MASATFEQAVPERDMLYLDKAWRDLQLITRPSGPRSAVRPAFRMFEGDVTFCDDGWIPWYRALAPEEMVGIADDLAALTDELAAVGLRRAGIRGGEVAYGLTYLADARTFPAGLVADGRGMAYMIG